MVLAFLHAKHSKSISRVQIASCFLPWNTRDTARSRFAGETPARSVTCIPTEKGRRELNVSDAVFLPFSNGESQLSIGSMVQRYKSDPKSARSVESVARSVVNRVGRFTVGSLKLIKIITFGRNSFVLRPHLNVKN